MNLSGFEGINFKFSDELKQKADQLEWHLRMFATKDKPKLSRELEKELHCAGPKIRAMVDYLILEKNIPIGSSGDGYWICTTRDEAVEASKHRKQRALKGWIVGTHLENIIKPQSQGRLL